MDERERSKRNHPAYLAQEKRRWNTITSKYDTTTAPEPPHHKRPRDGHHEQH